MESINEVLDNCVGHVQADGSDVLRPSLTLQGTPVQVHYDKRHIGGGYFVVLDNEMPVDEELIDVLRDALGILQEGAE